MKKAKRWLLMSTALLVLVAHRVDAVAPFKKVSLATTTASTTSTISTSPTPAATDAPSAEPDAGKSDNATATGSTSNSKLTGIPQIDYIWDPNLPRELRGYNLSTYPFFSNVPPEEDIHFKCDGLHDGFYASIEHKCQVYHHCVYGIRHDFLCANFTAFDQKTFICHFASDVDCEGSQKYWNRNDNLYMATTTTSTTTTTTEPPPTPRRRPGARPLRPLRRPINRRPVEDYYYDEDEYDDDYYEERFNRRRKQRPRRRKPVAAEYDDEYDEKRSLSEEEKPRRPALRERIHGDEDLEEDYDGERRKYDRPKPRNKPALSVDRRKAGGRKPGTILTRPSPEERRSFNDDRSINGRKDKLKPTVEDPVEPAVDTHPRRLAGRRRINEKRPAAIPATAASADADGEESDTYEKPIPHAGDEEEVAVEETPAKVKTTPKPLEEFVTPKAAPASVYARPRAPPRIARPVPVTEKKKFQYPVVKTATTVSPAHAHAEDEDYYEDEEYDEAHHPHAHPRRRIVDGDEDFPGMRRRNHNEAPLARKPTRPTLRKPVTDKKPILPAEEEEYDSSGSASNERVDSRNISRKRPFASRPRSAVTGPSGHGSDDVDFVDDDYDERLSRPKHRPRPKLANRKNPKKPRLPVSDNEEDLYEQEPERPLRNRPNVSAGRRKPAARLRQPAPTANTAHEPEEVTDEAETVEEEEPEAPAPLNKAVSSAPLGRPASVRVVKRPFLPSRGGSPYLPRGLQPVGVAHKSLASHTTDSTPIDMGSTISGVRLLEHGAPLLRDSGGLDGEITQSPRTTLPPRSAIPVSQTHIADPQPKVTLDELYENDYDVTLNDALNPTLKPLTSHPIHHPNRNYPSAFISAPAVNPFVNNNQSPAIHHSNNNNNNNNNNYQQQQQHQNAYQSVQHPLQSSLSQSQSLSHLQQQHPQQLHQHHALNNYNSDSYFSSTDIRRHAILPAPTARSSRTDYRGVGTRIAQHFYDGFAY